MPTTAAEFESLNLHLNELVRDGIVDPFNDTFQRMEGKRSLGTNNVEVRVCLVLKIARQVNEKKNRATPVLR